MKPLIALIFAVAALALAVRTTVIVPDIVGNEYIPYTAAFLTKGMLEFLLPDIIAVK